MVVKTNTPRASFEDRNLFAKAILTTRAIQAELDVEARCRKEERLLPQDLCEVQRFALWIQLGGKRPFPPEEVNKLIACITYVMNRWGVDQPKDLPLEGSIELHWTIQGLFAPSN